MYFFANKVSILANILILYQKLMPLVTVQTLKKRHFPSKWTIKIKKR